MRSIIFILLMLSLVCNPFAQQTGLRKIVLKVNLGGGPVGDFLGEDQVLETEGLHKTVTRDVIQNTDQQEIFQTQRFARDEDFVVRIPVPDGIYSVTLLFAETYKKACKTGARVFDISFGTPISGLMKILDNYDVFQAAGCSAAHGKRFDKVPSKGGIVVHLGRRAQHPSMCGFIVEGYPVPKGDGSEYRAVGQVTQPVKPEGLDTMADPSVAQGIPPSNIPSSEGLGTEVQLGAPEQMMVEVNQMAMGATPANQPYEQNMDASQSQMSMGVGQQGRFPGPPIVQ